MDSVSFHAHEAKTLLKPFWRDPVQPNRRSSGSKKLPQHMRYRVFLSYSHNEDDGDRWMERVRAHLESLNCDVRCSKTLRPGSGFNQQIKDEIARAHLFVPIITTRANEAGWVHQEIGFALAMNVPILPLAVGELPQGMTEGTQALALTRSTPDLRSKLTRGVIDQAAMNFVDAYALYQQAAFHEDRTRMLIDAAHKVHSEVPWDLVKRGVSLEAFRVRQTGALSSFSLPDRPYYDQAWVDCNGRGNPRSNSLCRDLQQERQSLQNLAQIGGADIIVSPNIRYDHRGNKALIARLDILIEFLETTAAELPHFRVIVLDKESLPGNLLILGDWFVAESTTPMGGLGYLQTLGTWHAPTVLRRKAEFDHEFARLLLKSTKNSDVKDSRKRAIRKLHEWIRKIRKRRKR